MNELEIHDEEDMDYEPQVDPPMHSNTPVRGTRMDDDEPQTTSDENETPAIQDDTPTTHVGHVRANSEV